jgi:hypothetical protein
MGFIAVNDHLYTFSVMLKSKYSEFKLYVHTHTYTHTHTHTHAILLLCCCYYCIAITVTHDAVSADVLIRTVIPPHLRNPYPHVYL